MLRGTTGRVAALMVGLCWMLSAPAATVSLVLDSTAEGGSSTAFAALHHVATTPAATGVVLLHGRNGTPDGVVVSELGVHLSGLGYQALSIEEPVPATGTAFSDYVADVQGPNTVFPELYARVRTAIDALAALGSREVVLVGFSLGARMASAHAARGQQDELPVVGLVGVGMYGNSIDPLNAALTLDEVSVPVLDIYGDADANAVGTAAARWSAYASGSGTDYTQIEVPCADPSLDCVPHNLAGYRGSNPVLEQAVGAWMTRRYPVSAVPLPASLPLFLAGLFGLAALRRLNPAS